MKNPDLHLDLGAFNYKKVLRFAGRYTGFVIGMALFSLLGYTGYLISQVGTATPDDAYVEAEIQKTDSKRIKLDIKTLEAVRALNSLDIKPDTANPGKTDPFSP